MGLWNELLQWLFGSPAPPSSEADPTRSSTPAPPAPRQRAVARKVRLTRFRYQSSLVRTGSARESAGGKKPYRFAHRNPRTGSWLDLSTDADPRWLDYYGLPYLKTPQELADWLGTPIGKLVWLTHRLNENGRPKSVQDAHYHYRWLAKRGGGQRLIEAPKPLLKQVQQRILRDILDKVPAHPQVHGFVEGRSILTNARPHVGRYVVLKFDLEDFYGSVHYRRVTAVFRGLGFSREVAIWLARLTTSAVPESLRAPGTSGGSVAWPYHPRHLPQGAATSPALANLSAYSLDVRLTGLAQKDQVTYTRYADDLTFSGSHRFAAALRDFIPLVTQIVRDERFRVNKAKRRVQRFHDRQRVTGVVVNEKPNVSREDYDRLKAILNNCVRRGPSTQNREQHPAFSAHLRGRIGHVLHLNPARGRKLLALYERIDWSR
jgi:hypothetical protein